MKTNKMLTLDIELVEKLRELQLNISEFCNEKLWTYVTEIEKKKENTGLAKEEIESKLENLMREREILQQKEQSKELMEKEGITDEMVQFLKKMSTNIMSAKDAPFAWEKKFGSKKKWTELRELKRKWA